MFCKYCGKEIPDNSKFCISCGKSISGEDFQQQLNDSKVISQPLVNNNSDKTKNNAILSFLGWQISEIDLRRQVTEYNTLKITQSSRGISSLLILFSSVITVIMAITETIDYSAIYGLIIYLPLAYCIYSGYKWAMITMIVFWTLEKGYDLFSGGGIMALVWWAIFIGAFYKAYKVEEYRSKNVSI